VTVQAAGDLTVDLQSAGSGTFFADNVLIDEVPALEGWINDTPSGGDVELENSQLKTLSIGSGWNSARHELTGLEVGKHYLVRCDIDTTNAGSSASNIAITGVGGLADVAAGFDGEYLTSFTAVAVSDFIRLQIKSNSAGDYTLWDNITVQETLVENGTFDTDTAWNKNDGWSIAGGVANRSGGTTTGSLVQTDPIPFVAGTAYHVSVDVANRANGGSCTIRITGGVTKDSPTIDGDGTFTWSFVADPSDATLSIRFAGSGGSGDFDNVIVTEALPDHSGQDNHAQVIGEVTRQPYLPPCDDRSGILVDDKNYITAQVTTGGTVTGYYSPDGVNWHGSTDLSAQFPTDVIESAGTLTIKGPPEGRYYAELVYNGP
jgi:hypothetical protein